MLNTEQPHIWAHSLPKLCCPSKWWQFQWSHQLSTRMVVKSNAFPFKPTRKGIILISISWCLLRVCAQILGADLLKFAKLQMNEAELRTSGTQGTVCQLLWSSWNETHGEMKAVLEAQGSLRADRAPLLRRREFLPSCFLSLPCPIKVRIMNVNFCFTWSVWGINVLRAANA